MRAADPADDAGLSARAAAGQDDAFVALMERHRAGVYRLVRGHMGDAEEAIDITQDAFVSAFRSIHRYDPSQPFRAWIARIAINKCRDWRRRRQVRSFFTFARPIDEGLEVASGDPPADETLVRDQDIRRLHAAIAMLPAALKEPLLLHSIDGLSQHETATVLRISEKAVETRLYRARARLRAILQEGSDAG